MDVISLTVSGGAVEEKSYLDLVLDYFLVLTAIFSVFSCCVCGLYMLQSRMTHIYKFAALQVVICVTAMNACAVPRMLMTNSVEKCELFGIIDHYFWIVFHAWLCSLAFECLQDTPCMELPRDEFRRRAWLHCILCYVLPIVLLAVTTLGHYTNPVWLGKLYGGRYCSMDNIGLFMFASVLPSSISIILGVFFLLVAIFRYQPQATAPQPPSYMYPPQQYQHPLSDPLMARARKWLINALVFIFLAGICWCIHLFYNIIRATWAFYFSIFMEQIKASIISLLMIYNARYEKRQDSQMTQDKMRAISMQSLSRSDATCGGTMKDRYMLSQFHSMYELRAARTIRPPGVGVGHTTSLPRSATNYCIPRSSTSCNIQSGTQKQNTAVHPEEYLTMTTPGIATLHRKLKEKREQNGSSDGLIRESWSSLKSPSDHQNQSIKLQNIVLDVSHG